MVELAYPQDTSNLGKTMGVEDLTYIKGCLDEVLAAIMIKNDLSLKISFNAQYKLMSALCIITEFLNGEKK